MKTLLTNCSVIRNAASPPARENIRIEDGLIAGFTPLTQLPGFTAVDLDGKTVIPGFVQTHVHFCQTMFRGRADDMALLDWLKYRIWPLEAAHTWESTYYSAMLSGMELISGGITTACIMESVRFADAAAQAVEDLGLRAVFGKAMMDYTDTPGALGDMPAAFRETTRESIDRSFSLYKRWHGAANGRISYAFMPRGILTTSREMLEELRALSASTGALIHTHACETWPESKLVHQRRGLTEIKYLYSLGLANERLLLAHCLCLDEEDMDILAGCNVGVASCPLANLKLASGIAPLARLRARGVRLSLGSDGAPCNNNLDMFQEMRFAALLQKGTEHDPTLMPAPAVFAMATQGGADVLGLGTICGSLEVGKKADLAVVDLDSAGTVPAPEGVSTLVYAGSPHLITDTMVDGSFVYRGGHIVNAQEEEIRQRAKEELKRLLIRFEGETV